MNHFALRVTRRAVSSAWGSVTRIVSGIWARPDGSGASGQALSPFVMSALERRLLMWGGPETVTARVYNHPVGGPQLEIRGSLRDDAISLSSSADKVTVMNGGMKIGEFIRSFSRVRVDLYDGDDSFAIDASSTLRLYVDAGRGNDTVLCGLGNDSVQGMEGNDTIRGMGGWNQLFGWDGDDQLFGGDDRDLLEGSSGNDLIVGNAGSDTIYAELDNDTVYGGAGDDTVYAGRGDDLVDGGEGNDRVSGQDGRDTLHGGVGMDRLEGGRDDDQISGGDGDDGAFGDDGADQIWGGRGNDGIFGGYGDDRLIDDKGNNGLDGGWGDDQLWGGIGDDVLIGAEGNDTLRGGAGSDILSGGSDDDLLFGDVGNDQLLGDEGKDSLYGESGSDRLRGGSGDDVAWGGPDSDEVDGGEGTDVLRGGTGDDTIDGGAGKDALFGEDGQDTLISVDDFALDVSSGGLGRDVFWVDSAASERVTDATTDERRLLMVNRVSEYHYFSEYWNVAPFNGTTRSFSRLPMYTGNGPRIQDAIQGSVGNCWLVTAIGGVANMTAGTDRIRGVITKLFDGNYVVRLFRNGVPQYYRIDANLPVNSNGQPWAMRANASTGLWAALIEKAYVLHTDGREGRYQSLNSGHVDNGWRALTNSGTRRRNFPTVGELNGRVRAALAEGRSVAVGTRAGSTHQVLGNAVLLDNHAYNVVSLSGEGDNATVVIRNPWGIDWRGTIAGSVRDNANDGFITLPITALHQGVVSLYFAG